MPDPILFGAFAILLLFHLLFIKKHQLFIHLIALYAAIAAATLLPRLIPSVSSWRLIPYDKTGAFVLLLIFFHFLLRFSALKNFSRRTASSQVGTSVIYHTLLVGLFFSVLLLFADISVGRVGALLFKNNIALLLWAIAPLFLAFSYRFKTKTGWLS